MLGQQSQTGQSRGQLWAATRLPASAHCIFALNHEVYQSHLSGSEVSCCDSDPPQEFGSEQREAVQP